MSEIGRGLPLLSGPPPPPDSPNAEIACRKCNKEFNMIFARARKCNHCGFSYCHSCTDYQALMPRTGAETGYDAMNVCAFCIEFLTITAARRNLLKEMPLTKLKKYISAYNIKADRAVEKDDLIDAIIGARMENGCLPPANENFYRKYSVPNKVPGRPRGIFSRSGQNPNASPPTMPPRPAPPPRSEFARPDLAPDGMPLPPRNPYSQPPQQPQYNPPPHPPPHHPPQQQQQQQYQQQYYNQPPPPPPRPHSAYSSAPSNPPPHFYTPPPPSNHGGYAPYHGYGYQQPPPPPPPHQYTRPPPQQQQPPYQPRPAPPPRQTRPAQPPPQAAPAPAPPPPQSRPRVPSTVPPPPLDQLLNMTHAAIGSLSISALKAILFTNHVNAGQILEKGDLVAKVVSLIEDEKRERERQRQAEAREEMERVQREEEARQERAAREQRQREERDAAEGSRAQEAAADVSMDSRDGSPHPGSDAPTDENGTSFVPSSSPKPNPATAPPKTQGTASTLERTGLCVICQDEEANIAIVDCGHMAMCRECSELIMSSSRECPLCRTRIVTEARLLRIFKT